MDGWHLTRTHDTSLGTVRWDHFGDPGGEPVVLLHGTPFSSFVWRGPARALAAHQPVYVWDMPGYGASATFEGQDLSLAAQSKVFTELLAHWALARPLVVAHDSGGAIALGTHILHGVAYRRLALVDAVALGPWGSSFFDLIGAHTEVFEQLPSRLHRAIVREYVSTASSPGLHPATLEALVAPWLGEDGQAAFYRQLAQRRADPDFTDEIQSSYGAIDMPVMMCWGADDEWVPIDRGRELAARVPGARFHTIPGAGHLVQEDRPAELTATLLPFLREPG